jgi:hypothetical protein
LANSSNAPAPTLQWRVGGGAWQGANLSWDNGSANGDPDCASPCWKTGIIGLDVPAHATLTIDVAVIFHCTGFSACEFMGNVDYTDDAAFPEYMPGVTISWSYDNPKGGGSGSGGGSTGSGGNAPGGGAGSSKPSVVNSRPPAPSRSAAPSTKAGRRPSPSMTSAGALTGSPVPASAASADLATVADTHAGGTGISSLIALIAVVLLALAAGFGLVVIRRRRAAQTSSEI